MQFCKVNEICMNNKSSLSKTNEKLNEIFGKGLVYLENKLYNKED